MQLNNFWNQYLNSGYTLLVGVETQYQKKIEGMANLVINHFISLDIEKSSKSSFKYDLERHQRVALVFSNQNLDKVFGFNDSRINDSSCPSTIKLIQVKNAVNGANWKKNTKEILSSGVFLEAEAFSYGQKSYHCTPCQYYSAQTEFSSELMSGLKKAEVPMDLEDESYFTRNELKIGVDLLKDNMITYEIDVCAGKTLIFENYFPIEKITVTLPIKILELAIRSGISTNEESKPNQKILND